MLRYKNLYHQDLVIVYGLISIHQRVPLYIVAERSTLSKTKCRTILRRLLYRGLCDRLKVRGEWFYVLSYKGKEEQKLALSRIIIFYRSKYNAYRK